MVQGNIECFEQNPRNSIEDSNVDFEDEAPEVIIPQLLEERAEEDESNFNAQANFDLYSVFSQISQETGSDIDDLPFRITKEATTTLICATFGGLLFGYDTGVISGVLIDIKPDDLHLPYISDLHKELITSVTCLGSIVGSILSNKLSDTYGRKPTFKYCMFIFIASSVIMFLSFNLLQLIIGRFLVGVSIGVATQVGPLYLCEISPNKIRGALMTLNTIAITGGQLLANLLSLLLIKGNTESININNRGHHKWRILLLLSSIPAILVLILLPFSPESPRYLVSKGLLKEAHDSLSLIYPYATREQVDYKLYRIVKDILKLSKYSRSYLLPSIVSQNNENTSNNNTGTISNPRYSDPNPGALINLPFTDGTPSILPTSHIDDEENSTTPLSRNIVFRQNFLRRSSDIRLDLSLLQNLLQKQLNNPNNYDGNICDPRTKKALTVGCILMFFQQIVGFNAFMYYSAIIFQPLTSNPLVPAVIVAFTNYIGTLFALNYIDNIGSRRMLLYTIPVMALGLLLSSYAFEEFRADDKEILRILLVALTIYVFGYAAAMGNVPWNSVSFLPLNKRSFGSSCISVVNWSTNFFVSITYLSFMNYMGKSCTMLFFLFMTILSWIFTYMYYPEIKGLSLEEIGQIFNKENGVDVNYVYRKYHI
ncbi:related to Probable metabolite transport protein YDR387C [Saccharomycodes ludwigii]|uniref:Related to Probable metabolite transport protein YDR387C n=1 Tax=Saccharomycodes ludwigii TaxID=36035 RepID=A0A376B4U7_9ASCO|nr:hypothetical protein SCDLUD_003248 [Saccharomycodes ludwigii]KAH3900276.1 hypothetical protein SCDLUD_003248 [Saccharomycodes ludwigii]SSD59715.1 related to Probable metabolite transport protein YDR387C [Saccharomycodes ludwigii]